MPKPTLEFLPVDSFEMKKPSDPDTEASIRILSEDKETGDRTMILYHPKGQEWGGENGINSEAKHEYWEEVLILRGSLHDKTLQKTFAANSYCCRPPGMSHGPWIADPLQGCEEIVWIKHQKADTI